MSRALTSRGLDAFVPLYDRVRQWSDRKQVVAWPLFPGYVFVRCGQYDFPMVLSASGVAAIVRTNGSPDPVPDADIDNVRRFAAALWAAHLEPRQVQIPRRGEVVRVVSGPLAGIEGIVVRGGGRHRVVISVQGMRHGFAMTVDAGAVELVNDTGPGRDRGL